jgi:hypothetical protein
MYCCDTYVVWGKHYHKTNPISKGFPDKTIKDHWSGIIRAATLLVYTLLQILQTLSHQTKPISKGFPDKTIKDHWSCVMLICQSKWTIEVTLCFVLRANRSLVGILLHNSGLRQSATSYIPIWKRGSFTAARV